MKILIFLLLLPVACGILVENCPFTYYKSMQFHTCRHIELYSKVMFHDITGENLIQLMPNRLYHNHGVYTSMSKNGVLYVGVSNYNDGEWIDAYKNI